MRLLRRRFVVFCAGLSLVIVAFLIGSQINNNNIRVYPISDSPSIKLNEISVQLPGKFSAQFAGEMVANSAGLFAREGLRVALHPNDAENQFSQITTGGDVIAISTAEQFLTMRAAGARIVAFASAFAKSTVVFYATEKSRILTPSDFIDRRVGYQPGRDTAIIYEALMDRLQISRSRIREIQWGSNVSLLMNGTVEVLPGHVGVEGWALRRLGIAYNMINPPDYGLHMPGTVYFTGERIIRDHPDTVRRFLSAVIAGWELTYSDEGKSAEMIAAFDGSTLDPEMVRFQLDQQRDSLRPYGNRFCELEESRWRLLQSVLVQQRRLANPIVLADAINLNFVRDVYLMRSQGSGLSHE